MRSTIFNLVTLILILKLNIFQKSFAAGHVSDTIKNEGPTISFDSCPVQMKGIQIKGERGERGPPGPQGPKGFDGEPGTCKCTCPPEHMTVDLGEYESRTPEDPVISCKYTDHVNGEIEVCEDSPFKVKCKKNGSNVHTCLRKNNKVIFIEDNREKISFALDDKPFWLSEKGAFNLQDFYFNYEMSQLEYLQKNSVFAIQKIRYHCRNSTVVPRNIPEKALQMLTWKEQSVGPVATNINPFHYIIEEDGCKDSTYNWSYTDIKLVGYFERLPVLDFYIADTGNGDQKLYIELLELCFG